jgi:hypothetical protein
VENLPLAGILPEHARAIAAVFNPTTCVRGGVPKISAFVDRERLIERERRWAVPAAVIALAPLVFYIVSIFVVGRAHLVSGSSEAAQLVSLDEHSGTVLITSVIRGIGFLLLPIPILYLFRAAQARNPRVQAAMVGFVFIGPILFGAQGIVQAVGAGQAASDFVKLPSETKRSYADYQAQVKQSPQEIDKVTIYTAADSLEVEQAGGSFYQVGFPSKDESKLAGALDAASIDNETDSDAGTGPPDAQASKITSDNGTLQASQGLLFPAVLGLVVMMVYIPLQALRAGLVPRFMGSLGIALGASMILILPIAILAMLAWTGFLGLIFVGRAPGGRPPAWDAGKAIPWPRPGDAPVRESDGGDAIEGDATEVGDEEGDSGSAAKAPQKRKRKSRG